MPGARVADPLRCSRMPAPRFFLHPTTTGTMLLKLLAFVAINLAFLCGGWLWYQSSNVDERQDD
jgi:hypothetical protein